MKVLFIAFSGTIAAKVAEQCRGLDTRLVGSSNQHITALCSDPALASYNFIVAAGVSTRRPRGFVRVEQVCSGGTLDTLLADGQLFKPTQTIGRSWCNTLASGLVLKHGRVAFLHIPAGVDTQVVAASLQAKLTQN